MKTRYVVLAVLFTVVFSVAAIAGNWWEEEQTAATPAKQVQSFQGAEIGRAHV